MHKEYSPRRLQLPQQGLSRLHLVFRLRQLWHETFGLATLGCGLAVLIYSKLKPVSDSLNEIKNIQRPITQDARSHQSSSKVCGDQQRAVHLLGNTEAARAGAPGLLKLLDYWLPSHFSSYLFPRSTCVSPMLGYCSQTPSAPHQLSPHTSTSPQVSDHPSRHYSSVS